MEAVDEIPFKTVKVDWYKPFFATFLSFGVPLLVVYIALVGLNTFVDFSVFEQILALLGTNMTFSTLLMYFLYIIIGIVFLASTLNLLMVLANKIYIYDNKLVINKSTSKFEIPYDKLVKITYLQKGMARTFKYGTIIFEVTAMENTTMELQYISQPFFVVEDIHKRLSNFKFQEQERRRINGIMERF